MRLAYVQHPFPAQGQTSHTAHLIVSEHATQEGSYVGLTRARHTTTIHAVRRDGEDADADTLAQLAERMSRTEPEVPSISLPLAHEQRLTTTPDAAPDPRSADQTPAIDRASDPTDHAPDPPHLTVVLGERPDPTDPAREIWQHGADAIERYRERYAIPADEPRPLGPEPPAGRFGQRHDRTLAAETVTTAVRQLGRDPHDHDRTASRGAELDALDRHRAREHDTGYEP